MFAAMTDGLKLPATIESDRLVLRAPRPRDAGMMSLYLGDARVAKSLALIPHPFPPGAAEQMIERALAGRRSRTRRTSPSAGARSTSSRRTSR